MSAENHRLTIFANTVHIPGPTAPVSTYSLQEEAWMQRKPGLHGLLGKACIASRHLGRDLFLDPVALFRHDPED